MAFQLVGNSSRECAEQSAKYLVEHQLNRIYDVQREAAEKADVRDIGAVTVAMAKLQSLSAKGQILVKTWGDFAADLKRSQEDEKPAEPEPEPEVAKAPETHGSAAGA